MAKVKLTNPEVTSLCINGKQIDADKDGFFDLPDDAGKALAEHGLGIKPAKSQPAPNGGGNG
jgi:hypothetical protein